MLIRSGSSCVQRVQRLYHGRFYCGPGNPRLLHQKDPTIKSTTEARPYTAAMLRRMSLTCQRVTRNSSRFSITSSPRVRHQRGILSICHLQTSLSTIVIVVSFTGFQRSKKHAGRRMKANSRYTESKDWSQDHADTWQNLETLPSSDFETSSMSSYSNVCVCLLQD